MAKILTHAKTLLREYFMADLTYFLLYQMLKSNLVDYKVGLVQRNYQISIQEHCRFFVYLKQYNSLPGILVRSNLVLSNLPFQS